MNMLMTVIDDIIDKRGPRSHNRPLIAAEAWAAPVPHITQQQQTVASSRSACTCAALCTPDLPPGLQEHKLAVQFLSLMLARQALTLATHTDFSKELPIDSSPRLDESD